MAQANPSKKPLTNAARLIRFFSIAFILILIGTILAVLLAPTRSNPLSLAQAAYLQGDYAEAIAQFTAAIAQAPNAAEAYIGRGLAYMQSGQVEAARGDFVRASDLDANDSRPLYQLGLIATSAGEYSSAIDYFNQMIALNAENASAYAGRAFVNAQSSNYVLAIEDYNQAIALDDTVADYYRGLGDAHFALDNTAEALAAYERYVQLAAEVDNEVFQRLSELRNR